MRMITIITPSYNRAAMVADAIESVLAQDFPNFEHIIVDAGSTDNTLQILKKYPHLKIISESDQGMYDALNKGLEAATGEIIGFLNTDDLYAENIFGAVASNFDDPDVMAVTGRAVVFSILPNGELDVVEKYFPGTQSLIEYLAAGGAFFNAWFFRRATFIRIGNFNPNFKIVGDGDFMFRFALSGLKYEVINELVYQYRMHEDSLTFDKSGEKRVRSADEHLTMINSYLAARDLPDPARKMLIQMQTSETIDMASRSIWDRNYKKFAQHLIQGSKYNPFWLVRFVQYVLKRGIALFQAKRSTKASNG